MSTTKAKRGKDLVLQREDSADSGSYTTIGGLRPTSFTLNNEQIDTTSKDGDNYRRMIAGGVQSLSVSGGGIVENDAAYKALALDAINNTLWNYRIIDGFGTTWDCEMQITSFGNSGEYTGEQEYTVSLESSDTVTVTQV